MPSVQTQLTHLDASNEYLGTAEAQTIIAQLGDPNLSETKTRSILRHEWQSNSVVVQQIETAVQRLLA